MIQSLTAGARRCGLHAIECTAIGSETTGRHALVIGDSVGDYTVRTDTCCRIFYSFKLCTVDKVNAVRQWRRQDFVTGGSELVRHGSTGGVEYEVPQSRLYCLCINVALCSTALQCICRVIRRNSTTMNAHTYYIIFGRPPIGGSFPPVWRRHCS